MVLWNYTKKQEKTWVLQKTSDIFFVRHTLTCAMLIIGEVIVDCGESSLLQCVPLFYTARLFNTKDTKESIHMNIQLVSVFSFRSITKGLLIYIFLFIFKLFNMQQKGHYLLLDNQEN